ncbi:MAG: protein-disulfide isomerase [Thermoproteota archaeon]|jgi:protein-disulfide isomerase
MKNKLIPILATVVVLAAIFFGGIHFYKKSELERLGFLASKNIELFYPSYSPVHGSENAKVIVTEFLDPECESCRRFYPEVKKVLKMYEGQVKLVVRFAALHRNSKHAIKVLEATRKQGKFWESLELLFQYQPAWASHHNPRPLLVFKFLPEVGVDIEQVKIDMNDPEILKHIEQDDIDMKKLKVRGTPTFFVNGQPLENFGVKYLKSAIDREVKKYYSK